VKTIKSLRHSFYYYLALLGFFLIRCIPRPLGLLLFGALGRFVFLFPNTEKRRTIDHLRLIFGSEWTEKKILATARNVYASLGKNLFDGVKLSRASKKRFHEIVKHDDLSEFKTAFDGSKGMIVITAHIGCFEMLLHFFARHGFKSFAVGTPTFDPRLDEIVATLRSGEGIDYMYRTESPRKIIRNLQAGQAFGVLIDQDTSVEGVFAKFLGRTAYTPSAPLRMAMKYKIPAVVATTVRKPDNTHYVYISKIIELADTGDFERDLLANVQKANDLICKTIREYPEQWVWMHRRWKRQPPSGI
jgi:Kdo2-lipid IVA lauroyltransferase/acyltransferase